MKEFKDRLQHVMNANKISRQWIMQRTSYDSAQISRWLSGSVIPRRATIIRLTDILGCSWKWLEDGTGEPFPQRNTLDTVTATNNSMDAGNNTNEPQGKYLKSIILMWEDISEEDQQAVFSSVKKAKQMREMMTELAGIKKKVGE